MSTDEPTLLRPATGALTDENDLAPPDPVALWPALAAGEVIAAWGGVTVRRLPDWLPPAAPEPPPTDQPQLPLPGPRPIGDLCPDPFADIDEETHAGRGGDTTCHDTKPGSQQGRGEVSGRLISAATVLLVECLAGRRPLTHLNGACSQQARIKVRLWPRGAGWSRMEIRRPVRIQSFASRIEGVVLLDHTGHRLALGLEMRRQGGHWLIGDVDLVLSPQFTALLQGHMAAA